MINKIDNFCVNHIRAFGMDVIDKAKSGHPGIVLGAAPIIHTLYTRILNTTSLHPNYYNRDRFILSAGHGSMLLYTVLHLAGFPFSKEDLLSFRQLNSKCAGHPEHNVSLGIETTTGPLGQGIANAVGLAVASKHLQSKYNKKDLNVVDNYIYALCGDGDLQEGVALEAISFAGHNKLDNLIILFDSNDIQLDGATNLTVSEDVKKKFESMNWAYLKVEDGNDCDAIANAILEAKKQTRPVLIEIKTIIGHGSSMAGTSDVHGAPIGLEKTKQLKQNLGISEELFNLPQEVYDFYNEHALNRSEKEYQKWINTLNSYKERYPQEYEEFMHFVNDDFELDIDKIDDFDTNTKEATRDTCGKLLKTIGNLMPNFIGGSADLTKSTKAKGVDGDFSSNNYAGRNINFGVREHAMGAICNAINLYGGFKSFSSGFFVFSDYLKPALRMAALMELPALFIFSHDTVCVGEDGPTHEPIEQFTMLRSIPNFNVIRPCDAIETKAALIHGLQKNKYPTCITTTRQPLQTLSETSVEKALKGAYIVRDYTNFEGIIIASGSEVSLALDVADKLALEGIYVRVVSMPSMFLFEKQSDEYKEEILPRSVEKRLSLEMASTMPWYKYAKNCYGIDRFGISAPLKEIPEYFGFTVENIVKVYKNIK